MVAVKDPHKAQREGPWPAQVIDSGHHHNRLTYTMGKDQASSKRAAENIAARTGFGG